MLNISDDELKTFILQTELDHETCDKLIDEYKQGKPETGAVNGKVQKEKKDSLDLKISPENILYYTRQIVDLISIYFDIWNVPDISVESYNLQISEPVQIQYYKPGGGFKKWHFETAGSSETTLRRMFVFMTYLNDVPDGGTEFLFQKEKIPAEKGRTIIWPAHFTHVHRGQITEEHEKYIATGWISAHF